MTTTATTATTPTTRQRLVGRRQPSRVPRVDVVVPVYNEQADLERSIRRLHRFLAENVPYDWRIVIADNASVDETPEIAAALSRKLTRTSVVRLELKGRGRALRTAWSASDADVVCYMDVDLSTDLGALMPMIGGLLVGDGEVAIGTRLSPESKVVRGAKREFISRSYNRLLRLVLRARFSDAQCGFKAVRRDAAARLLPQIKDDGWFFDTELLVLAQRNGMRILEVPVIWIDDPDSRVNIVKTAIGDLKGVARLLMQTPLARFLAIGVVSTIAYALLYLLLAPALGDGGANALSLALTAVANTQANRYYTFGVRGRKGLLRQHAAGALVYLLALGLTFGALAVLHGLDPHPGSLLEVTVLVIASLAATMTRYVALRTWVFARHARGRGALQMVAQ
ncbi:MAG: glycosyltransferase [Solirubrobacteraceae bacterium]